MSKLTTYLEVLEADESSNQSHAFEYQHGYIAASARDEFESKERGELMIGRKSDIEPTTKLLGVVKNTAADMQPFVVRLCCFDYRAMEKSRSKF